MSRNPKHEQYIRLDRLQEVCKDNDTAHCGYGYSKFINLVGLSKSTFTNVIYYNRDFSVDNLIKISKVTGVSIDWLLGLSERKYINEQ